jgi:hypothetical protein
MVGDDERGQAVTLEAIAAGLVLLSSVVFALQMTAVTPLSASTSSQHIENQLEASAEGLLASTVADGSLKRAILYYNESSSTFIGGSGQNGVYRGSPPDNQFGRTLEWAFDRRGIAYNVYVTYDVGSSDRTRRMYYRGEPSDNAVTAQATVTLTEDTPLYDDTDGDGIAEPRSLTVSDTDGYLMGNQSTSGLYNVARIEVVVWRI